MRPADATAMPILTGQPEASEVATHPATLQRQGGASIGSHLSPPRDLLPSGGVVVPAPVPAPARALALDALRLLRRLRDPARRPERWSQPAFSREIQLVRAHLAPLRTRKALAASYGREAFHLSMDAANRDDPGPVRLAYALRWLELGAGDIRTTWPPLEVRGSA
ncbi:MAG: hypothetical protein QOD78_2318 [Chloroflexota bacterium]|nr:hypothetical protein [Chloroflexota bacterium]